MKIVALVKTPSDLQAAAKVLVEASSGMTLAEARMRLAPEPPALLARLVPEAADALANRLQAGGLAALAVSTLVPPGRVAVRHAQFDAASVRLRPRLGEPLELAYQDIAVILRGASSVRSQTEAREKQKSLAIGTALATGGLKMTKTTDRLVHSSSEEVEQSIFVYAADGRSAVLHELSMEFAWLGAALQPSRTANMTAIAKMFRDRAPAAFYDERLVRLGRRPMPFLAVGETQVRTDRGSTSSQDTAGVLDILAEVLHQAARQRMLP